MAYSRTTRFIFRTCSNYVTRSHTCGDLSSSHIGKQVRVSGWIRNARLGNKFVVLRDSYGSIQLHFDQQKLDLPLESVLDVTGIVTERPKDMRNKEMASGDIEINVESVNEVYPLKKTLPFHLPFLSESRSDDTLASESLRLKYRYLDIRTNVITALKFRSSLVHAMRVFFSKHDFLDVETPSLFRRTPGGAQEFVVPSSSHPGKFYSLIQSPQQFKQLLMVGGVDRYYQVARCYRDEGGRSDRQPEFTQIDVEMSFVDRDGIKSLVQDLLIQSWPFKDTRPLDHSDFACMTYTQAMEDYGSDKPDIRFEHKIQNVSSAFDKSTGLEYLDELRTKDNFQVQAIVFGNGSREGVLSNKKLKNLSQEVLKRYTHEGILSIFTADENGSLHGSMLNKCSDDVRNVLSAKPFDFGFMFAGEGDLGREILGLLRLELGNLIYDFDKNDFKFLWVQDFPLFEKSKTAGIFDPAHHPFTQPHPEDIHLLHSHTLQVRSLHYDLVLNGSEIGGGSIRIHDSQLQRSILEDFLKEDAVTDLSHLLEALDHGCPPHGGFAIGLDRYIAILMGTKSIRDVIAFPKASNGRDLMCDSPTNLSQKEKKLYKIDVNE